MANQQQTGAGAGQPQHNWRGNSGAGSSFTAGDHPHPNNVHGNGNGNGNGNGYDYRRWYAGTTGEGPRGNAQANWQSSWFSGANIDWSTFTGNGQGNGIGNQGTGNGMNNGQGYSTPPVSTSSSGAVINSANPAAEKVTTSLIQSHVSASSGMTSSAVGSLAIGTSTSSAGVTNGIDRLTIASGTTTLYLLYFFVMVLLYH